MNIQKYSAIYSRFHDSFTPDHDRGIIILPLKELAWEKSITLRLQFFDRIENESKPLVKALKIFYRTDDPCTVFQSKDSWSLLVGNEKIVFPDRTGNIKLYATHFFVKDPKYIDQYLSPVLENIYIFNGIIMYLDETDIPYPGGRYFSPYPFGKSNQKLFRLCFISTEPCVDKILSYWSNKREILSISYKTKPAIPIFGTLDLKPFSLPVTFPDAYAINTGTIKKELCFKNPKFLIQDILNSYSGLVDDLGIYIEYPLQVRYESSSRYGNQRQFVGFAVNGHQPKRVLHIRDPYERYTEYEYVPSIEWTWIYYESRPMDLRRVVIDSTVIGFVYREAFFCLSFPLFEKNTLFDQLNTEYLLNYIAPSDLSRDPDIDIIDTFRYDATKSLHRVKHKSLRHDLWCITETSIANKFAKRGTPPYLVQECFRLAEKVNYQKTDFGDLKLIKLAIILARHKICFSLRMGESRNMFFEKGTNVIFEFEEPVVKFLNDLRLDVGEVKESQSECIIS